MPAWLSPYLLPSRSTVERVSSEARQRRNHGWVEHGPYSGASSDASTNPETKNVHMSMNESYNDSKVGHATVESIGSTKTWDGFSKTNEVPAQKSNFSRINDREKNRKKRAMIKKLKNRLPYTDYAVLVHEYL